MIETLAPSGASGAPPPSSALLQGPGGKLGKEEFLKLLVAQLRHQDPLSPMNADEMAVQLAQFSSVEQLMGINERIGAQQEAQEAMLGALHATSALGALGKTVTALGDAVVIPESGGASVRVSVGDAGGSAVLRVFDAAGNEVGSRALGSVPGGVQSIELGSAADGLPPGKYTYAVEVRGPGGEEVPVQTFTTARIDGVRYGSEGPTLVSGPLSIPIGSVVEIVAGQ